jgi:AraC-like DNA-binding protein
LSPSELHESNVSWNDHFNQVLVAKYCGALRFNLRLHAMKEQNTPLLSMAHGFYHEKPVLPELRQHFSAVWFHRKPAGVQAHSAVVPDACADLVWCRSDLLIAGPDRQVSLEPVPPGATAIRVRLLPGAIAALLRVPASEIAGARIPLESVWGSKARRLVDEMAGAEKPHAIAECLEIALAKTVANIDSPSPLAGALLECVATLRDPGRPIIPQWMAALKLSERTIRRECQIAFGYGPKTLDRVLRMQRFLRLARARPGLGLVNLAGAAGYADQAHLCREARRLAGLAPREILQQLSNRNDPEGE